MDPFTQRMLERAKARREKLDTQLSNAGHDVKRRRSPLRDANVLLAQTPVITDVLKKSPTKTVKPSVSPTGSPAKTTRRNSPPSSIEKIKKEEKPNKENGDDPITNVKSKLQRLGKLYSDDNRELSSPIHRTEEKFAVEDIKDRVSAKPCARTNRLKNLASEISNWEDDLSHPTLAKPTISKAERVQAKMNEQVKSASDSQPGTSGLSRFGNKKDSPTKPVKWDKCILESLEAQGFRKTKSSSRLVYDYTACSQGSSPQKSPTKSPVKSTPTGALPKIDERTSSSVASSPASTRSTDSQHYLRSPDKSIAKGSAGSSPAVSNSRLNSRFGFNGSPKTSLVQSPGSVLSKASMFESKGSATKTKDPAEMTLSERKALFERNKGEALIPKAPLTMSVPTKMLQDREKTNIVQAESSKFKPETGKTVDAQRSIFEQGNRVQELENNILQSVQAERQRELEMLRSRFNRHREIVQSSVGASMRTSESSDAGKPNSPKNSPVCPVKPTPAPEQTVPPPPPPMPSSQNIRRSGTSLNKHAPPKRQVTNSPTKQNHQMKKLDDSKRVKISSPSRFNRLYPDLNNISSSETETETEFTVESTEAETATLDEQTETGTEAEYYVKNTTENDSSDDEFDDYEDDDDICNTSLGRSILQAVSQNTPLHKKRSIDPDPDSTTSDISVLDEMDEYLDECLARQESTEEGPTPPKLNKSGKSPSAKSHSFKYTQGSFYRSPIKIVSPTSSPGKQRYNIIDDDSDKSPLVHSISLYRKQQSQTPKTSSRVVTRVPDVTDSSSSYESAQDKEADLVQEKVQRLLEEVQKQQTIIGQASQALNLCNSTIEFSGSQEQVEGERLLLVATHRRQAALHEVQRLKVEGSLRPVVSGAPEIQESGSLTISAITLPLKKDFFRQLEPDTCLHFVCLVRYLDTVIATPVVRAQSGDSCIRFPSTLKLQDLYSDFKVTIEVYTLKTRAEILPHDIKYHIHGGNSKKSGKTPKKSKHDNKLIMPSLHNAAGPSAVRTPSFTMAGFMIFSLKEVQRQQFTLSRLLPVTPLEGRLQMHVSCELTVAVDHHGFLTMFEDISGFGAWHRRWCLLKGATLSYWKYPDDERKKTPIGSLDLQTVTTTNVNLVSRDICARPHTFLLESSRPAQPGDKDSLVMVRNGPNTTIRHLLSADTKEDRLEWCAKLSKTLHLIHAWGGEFKTS